MKFGFLLILLGLAQIAFVRDAGPFSWLLGWSGASWVLAGAGYGAIGARALGKRLDGGMIWWNVALLFPFLAATWILWRLQRKFTREPRYVEVVPGIWLGRRCSGNELPSGVKMVVDMTAEFHEPESVRTGRTYLCVPTLDTSVPSLEDFQALIHAIARFPEPVYVHCALGHGRSATVVIAALMATGNAASVEEAERIVKRARPGVGISAAQRRLLQQWSDQQVSVSSPTAPLCP